MKNKETQRLTEKWIKIYGKESDEDIRKVYEEDFAGKSTPRRKNDVARKCAIEALMANSSVASNTELEFQNALVEASKWQEQLTEHERTKIGFSIARKNVLERIFQKYKGIIKE